MDEGLQQACEVSLGASVRDARPVGGGSISSAWRVATDNGTVFVKATAAANEDWFEAEADGLRALARCGEIRVPEVLATVTTGGRAYLVLSWLELARPSVADDARLGVALASLHAITARRYGWSRDNYIGATPQHNGWCDDWSEFVKERRIGPQLKLAAASGFATELRSSGDALLERIAEIIGDDGGPPCLLHGDLWGGNRGVAGDGLPVLYDPAVYYGDAESDLAMTELFGGFGAAFYAAYEEARPPRGDVARRRDLYRLYHLLNHLNLFGGGYLSQCLALMRRLAAT